MKQERPPILAVLGHVDHGKTTLLDTIRNTSVAAKEAGGITQRIGAYEITTKENKVITFIDTPGHELFNSMRKRGIAAADIALLVIAADDSVKPQTIESLDVIRKAEIPFIVVINKIDLPGALPEKVIKDLTRQNVILEGRGGDIPYVEISAKTGKNLETLFELIVLVSEMNDFSCDLTAPPEGVIIEVHKDNRGIVATTIVRNGTVRVGDTVYIEDQEVKIRALITDRGTQVKQATPSMPVALLGLKNVVPAGSALTTVQPSKKEPEKALQQKSILMEDAKKFYFIVRADTYGSLEVLRERLTAFDEIELLQTEVGDVTERDIDYAETSGANILAYKMPLRAEMKHRAEQMGVTVFEYDLAYELVDEIEDLIIALREKREKESRKRGEARVQAVFKKGRDTIAGVKITTGFVEVGMVAEQVRGKKITASSIVRSLYRKVEPIVKAERGTECGFTTADSIDFHQGDVIKFYVHES